MNVFQIAEVELNEISLKRLHVGLCFQIYVYTSYVLSWHFYDISGYTETIFVFFSSNVNFWGVNLKSSLV